MMIFPVVTIVRLRVRRARLIAALAAKEGKRRLIGPEIT